MRKVVFSAVLVLLCSVVLASGLLMPVVKAPMIVTTLGQSPGALMFRLVCVRSKIACVQEDLLTATQLKELAQAPDGPKTLVITTGTSLKGMGAAGIDINLEVQRVEDLIKQARELGMTVIGAHIEGMARRVDATDEKSITTVIPKSDLILVIASSDEDGYFTKFSETSGIPLLKVNESLDIGPALLELINAN